MPTSFVDAVYRQESIAAYAGNPYIEALPPLKTDAELMKALAYMPKFDPAEKLLESPERIQRLDVIQKIVVPIPRLVSLARSEMKMMTSGYGQRRPFSAHDNATLQRMYELQQSGNFDAAQPKDIGAQHSMSLIGASGCGKSCAINAVTKLLPPVIYHEKTGKWQLPFLVVEMPYDGQSIHTLAGAIFASMDRLLGDSNYVATYIDCKGGNAEQRLAKALYIAYEHGVGLIVIDESQNQREIGNDIHATSTRRTSSKKANETPLTKLLITASNTSHIPIVFAGTLEMQDVSFGRFSKARRMAGHGSSAWLPFERTKGRDGEFELMTKCMLKYQWTRSTLAYSEEWADMFHKMTQGIPDIMFKLFESAQVAAISTGKEEITHELVQRVFDSEFITTNLGISALRNKDQRLLDIVSDLFQVNSDADTTTMHEQFPRPSATETGPAATLVKVPRVEKPDLPSPKGAPISLDAVIKADVRVDSPGGKQVSHMTGDEWHQMTPS